MPRKDGLGKREKPSTLTQAINAHMGEEEKNRKQKDEQKETGSRPPTQLPGPFGHLLRPAWIIQWAYSEIYITSIKHIPKENLIFTWRSRDFY